MSAVMFLTRFGHTQTIVDLHMFCCGSHLSIVTISENSCSVNPNKVSNAIRPWRTSGQPWKSTMSNLRRKVTRKWWLICGFLRMLQAWLKIFPLPSKIFLHNKTHQQHPPIFFLVTYHTNYQFTICESTSDLFRGGSSGPCFRKDLSLSGIGPAQVKEISMTESGRLNIYFDALTRGDGWRRFWFFAFFVPGITEFPAFFFPFDRSKKIGGMNLWELIEALFFFFDSSDVCLVS